MGYSVSSFLFFGMELSPLEQQHPIYKNVGCFDAVAENTNGDLQVLTVGDFAGSSTEPRYFLAHDLHIISIQSSNSAELYNVTGEYNLSIEAATANIDPTETIVLLWKASVNNMLTPKHNYGAGTGWHVGIFAG